MQKNKHSNYKKIIKIIFILILGIYLLLNIFLFLNQKDILYFSNNKDFYDCKNLTDSEKKAYKNTKFYEITGKNNNVIIFFHGNAGRACERTGILDILKKTGNTIILVEYYGYADKNKAPNIKMILQDVRNIGNYLKDKNFDKTYVMGRSLGTGPASYFAKSFKTDKLLLVSAYDELYKVASKKYPIFPIKYLFTQNYKSINYLNNFKNNFLLIHGKKDKVIPYNHGLDLYNNLDNINKEILSLDNGTHHNIFEFDEVKRKIIEYFSN